MIREHLARYKAAGVRLMTNFYLGLLAEAEASAGSLDIALSAVDEALTVTPDHEVYNPYLFWLRGELHLKSGSEQQAEQDFKEAIACARRIGGKFYELRATTSLARLTASQGRREEARLMLAEIYNWFTEGLDTTDLIDARKLLDELEG
jgi:predicted ATPase